MKKGDVAWTFFVSSDVLLDSLGSDDALLKAARVLEWTVVDHSGGHVILECRKHGAMIFASEPEERVYPSERLAREAMASRLGKVASRMDFLIRSLTAKEER